RFKDKSKRKYLRQGPTSGGIAGERPPHAGRVHGIVPDVGVAESEKVAQQRTGGSQEVSVQNEPRHHAQSDQTAAASAAPRTSSQERSSAPVSSAATSQ